jgi:hypothetical protein
MQPQRLPCNQRTTPLHVFSRPGFNTRIMQVNDIGLYNSIQTWFLQLLLDRGGLKLSDSDTLLSQHSKCPQAWKAKHTSVLLLPGETTSVPQLAVEVLRSFECQLEMFYKHKDRMLAWTLPVRLAHQVFSYEGADPARTVLSAEILATAPFSVRHTCLHIHQSINMFHS